jgi:hypothetical protein
VPRSFRTAVLVWLADAILVTAFVVIGRRSHGEDAAGFALTLLPFFAALQTGWLLRAGRNPIGLPAGAIIWGTTVVLGLLLRVAIGDDAPLPFVLVTAVTLAVFLLGWRGVVALIRRRYSGGRRDRSGSA